MPRRISDTVRHRQRSLSTQDNLSHHHDQEESLAAQLTVPAYDLQAKPHTWSFSLSARTVGLKDAPKRVMNPYLLSGYRANYSVWECIASMLQVHNDTLNIWTHLLGAVYFIVVAPAILADLAERGGTGYVVSTAVYLACAVACHGLSTIYHVFRALQPGVYQSLLNMDISGIVLLIGGSYVMGLHNGFGCETTIQHIYLGILAVLLGSALALTLLPVSQNPKGDFARLIMLLSSVAYGAFPMGHWVWRMSVEERWIAAPAFIGMFGCYFLGFVVYAAKWPERYFPRVLDVVAPSHALWHMFVFAAAYAWLHGQLAYTHYLIESPAACPM